MASPSVIAMARSASPRITGSVSLRQLLPAAGSNEPSGAVTVASNVSVPVAVAATTADTVSVASSPGPRSRPVQAPVATSNVPAEGV